MHSRPFELSVKPPGRPQAKHSQVAAERPNGVSKDERPITLDDEMTQPRERVGAGDPDNRKPWIERDESAENPDTSGYGADIVQGSRFRMRVALEIMQPKFREG